MKSKTHYITKGQVRGSCGHKHRTIPAACLCQKTDSVVCGRLLGGYSDRYVRVVENGEERMMTEAEHTETEAVMGRLVRERSVRAGDSTHTADLRAL